MKKKKKIPSEIFSFPEGKFFANEKESEREREKGEEKIERKIYIRNFHQTKVTFFFLQSEKIIWKIFVVEKKQRKKKKINENWKLSWKKVMLK